MIFYLYYIILISFRKYQTPKSKHHAKRSVIELVPPRPFFSTGLYYNKIIRSDLKSITVAQIERQLLQIQFSGTIDVCNVTNSPVKLSY